MPEAIEITSFKLVKNATIADFIRANADVDAWLADQPGFRSRWIAVGDDDVVVDTLLWASGAMARGATARLLVELRDSPVHSVIDQRTVSWRVSEIHHFLQAPPAGTDSRRGKPRTETRR